MPKNQFILSAATMVVLSIPIGCSGSHTDNTPVTPPPPPPPAATFTGVLTDSPVQGVAYSTSTNLSGITDATGQFTYHASDTMTFKLGTLTLGSAPAAGIITPIELAGGSENKLQNLLVLLQSLDSDRNAANGISISPAAAAAVTASVDLSQAPSAFASSANTSLQSAMTAGGITAPIVTTAQANAAFLTQGMALLSSNIWAMADATTAVALRVNANGSYIQAGASPTGGGGMAGVEVGVTTVAGFDSHGYWLSPGVTSVDTNGESGLSHPRISDRFNFSGDAIIAGDYLVAGDSHKIPKMENNPTGIVGAWAVGSATTFSTYTFYFFSNGKYLMVDPIGGDAPGGHPGVEFGSYTYDSAAKILKVFNLTYDTNGTSGLSNGPYASPAGATVTISSDGKTFAAGGGEFTFYRVSK